MALHMRAHARPLAALLLTIVAAGSTSATAAEIVFANLAPATLEASSVTVAIDGTPGRDEFSYRSFTRITTTDGPHVLRVDVDGESFEFEVTAGSEPSLAVLHGVDGALALDVHDAASIAEALGDAPASTLLRHHYATGAAALVSEYECASDANVTSAGQVIRPGDTAYAALAGAEHVCTVRFRDAAFSVIEAEVPLAGYAAHVFLIGDGELAPYETLTFSDSRLLVTGPVDFSPGPSTTAGPGSLLDSPTFWFDADRPLQGVSLFEMPGTGLVYGTWFGVDDSGRATWLAIEGSAVYGGALRDLRISELTRGEAGLRIDVIGSGTLQYNDCNHAELRLFLRERELRTLRIERSRPVQACVALERGGLDESKD